MISYGLFHNHEPLSMNTIFLSTVDLGKISTYDGNIHKFHAKIYKYVYSECNFFQLSSPVFNPMRSVLMRQQLSHCDEQHQKEGPSH